MAASCPISFHVGAIAVRRMSAATSIGRTFCEGARGQEKQEREAEDKSGPIEFP